METLIEHATTRDRCIGFGLIKINSDNADLQLGTLKTIANSLQLVLLPLDIATHFNLNTFVVAIHNLDPEACNPDMFNRLIQNPIRHTNETSDQRDWLKIAVSIRHSHVFKPAPTISEITSAAHQVRIAIDIDVE
jgi:hypothetical protein